MRRVFKIITTKVPWHNVPGWRIAIIHVVAKVLGVTVQVGGLPYGSWRNKNWESDEHRTGDQQRAS